MSVYILLVSLCWLAFLCYWLISAVGVKRNVGWSWYGILIRFSIAAAIVLFLQIHSVDRTQLWLTHIITNPYLNGIGTVCCVAGVGLAIWARVHLGRNWGMPMSRKEDPELVTSGPYTYIRNPIYTGVMLAMLGSSLVVGLYWLIIAVAFGAYFIYSAKIEEKIMLQAFPTTYPAYKKRTKMLIPFVL